jgi:hypothetical protein
MSELLANGDKGFASSDILSPKTAQIEMGV